MIEPNNCLARVNCNGHAAKLLDQDTCDTSDWSPK